jgi:hypothetical protein
MRHRTLVTVLVAVLIGSVLPGCARRSPTQPGPAVPPGTATSTAATPSTAPAPTPGRTTTKPNTPKPGTTATTKAPAGLPDRLRGRDFERIPTTRPVVALTFDAGSTDAGLRPILDTLTAQHVPATFFVTGRFADRYPDGIQAITAGGHRLGNHSYTHPYFTKQTDRQITAELSRAEAALQGTAPAAVPLPLRRPRQPRHRRSQRQRVHLRAMDRRHPGLERHQRRHQRSDRRRPGTGRRRPRRDHHDARRRQPRRRHHPRRRRPAHPHHPAPGRRIRLRHPRRAAVDPAWVGRGDTGGCWAGSSTSS